MPKIFDPNELNDLIAKLITSKVNDEIKRRLEFYFGSASNLSLKQTQRINISILDKIAPNLLIDFLSKFYLNLSMDQFMYLSNGFIYLDDDRLKKLKALLETITKLNAFGKFFSFIDPVKFPLERTEFDKMPKDIRILYLNYYPDKINDDLKPLFQDSVNYIFQNPQLFCLDIFPVLINSWPKDVINPALKSIDINQFPKQFFNDLIEKYELSYEIIMRFEISKINDIDDKIKRKFIFEYFLSAYYRNITNKDAKEQIQRRIQEIKIEKLSKEETEYLIQRFSKEISEKQAKKIKVEYLKVNTLAAFLNDHSNEISPDQLNKLNFIFEKISKIINESQIAGIKMQYFDKEETELLIIILIMNKKIKLLSDEQIASINFNYINPTVQEQLIKDFSKKLTEAQIQNTKFSESGSVEMILTYLIKSKKLDFLTINQIKQINILQLNNLNLIHSLFEFKNFASFFTNNIHCYINDKNFDSIDFSNVEDSFLAYSVFFMINKFTKKQKEQIPLAKFTGQNQMKMYSNLSGKIIEFIDLQLIKSFNYDIYLNLLIIKGTEFSINQYITINWRDEEYKKHMNSEINPFQIISQRFTENLKEKYPKINQINNDILYENIPITKDNILNLPAEMIVAIINSRILNKNFDSIPPNLLEYFLPAIKMMIKMQHHFLYPIEYIINSWSKEYHDILSQLIPDINIELFNENTLVILLKYYLPILKQEQLQKISFSNFNSNLDIFSNKDEKNINKIFAELIDNVIEQRADDLNPEQFLNVYLPGYENLELIIQQLTLIKNTNIQRINLTNFLPVFLNFIVNKHLNELNNEQIQQINIQKLNINLCIKLIQEKLLIFSQEQIQHIDINQIQKINGDLINSIIINRYNDITVEQITTIKKENLNFSGYYWLLYYRYNDLPKDMLENKDINTLINETIIEYKIKLINKCIRKFSKVVIQNINIENAQIAAIIILYRTKDASDDQIKKMELKDEQINEEIQRIDPSKNFLLLLRESHRFSSLNPKYAKEKIDCSNFENLIEMLTENLTDSIRSQDIKNIQITRVMQFDIEFVQKLVNSHIHQFTQRQLNDLPIDDNIAKRIINLDLYKCLSVESFQKIDFSSLNIAQLIKIITNRPNDLSIKQIRNPNFDKALTLLNNEVLWNLIKKFIYDLSSDQIRLTNISQPETLSFLLIYRIEDMSITQLQRMDVNQDLPFFDEEKNKKETKICITFLIGKNRIKDLTQSQIDSINYTKLLRDEKFSSVLDETITRLSSPILLSLDSKNELIADGIVRNKLFNKLSPDQKINFSTISLLKLLDENLIDFVNSNWGILKANICFGIILYKYLNNPSIDRNNLIDKYIKQIKVQRRYDDIYFAKFIIIAENELGTNNISFTRVSKNFFLEFKDRCFIDTISKRKELIFKYDIFEISPEDFAFIHEQKLITAKENNDVIPQKIEDFINKKYIKKVKKFSSVLDETITRLNSPITSQIKSST